MKTGAPSQKENHFSQNSFQKHIALHTLSRISPVYMIQFALHKLLSLGEHSEMTHTQRKSGKDPQAPSPMNRTPSVDFWERIDPQRAKHPAQGTQLAGGGVELCFTDS